MDDILDELRLISPVLAGIQRVNPYAVPEGYFESLPDRIGQLMGSTPVSPTADPALPGASRQNPYSVPDDFFGSFADKLMARIRAQQADTAHGELAALSPLLSGLNKQLPFETPSEYFGELSSNIMAGVRAIDFVNDELGNLSPVLTELRQLNVYTTPAGYFEQLPGAVMNTIRERSQSGALSSDQQTRGLSSVPVIPIDERTQTRDLSRTGETGEHTPVVPISERTPVIPIGRRKWMRMASAAVVSGLILTAGWLHFSRPVGRTGEGGDAVLTASLSRVSDQEIENFVDNQHPSLSEVLASTNSPTTLDISDADVKNMIGDVPDEELQQYLEDNGSQKDLSTN